MPPAARRAGPDPYAVLGIPRDADTAAIHAAYRRAVRRTHPDAGGTASAFEAVQDAYETLRDPTRRAAHDGPGPTRAPPRPTPPPRPEPESGRRAMDDLLADSQRLENEARRLAGLRPRDFGTAPAETGDSFTAILGDAERQLRDAASVAARELRRRLRRVL